MDLRDAAAFQKSFRENPVQVCRDILQVAPKVSLAMIECWNIAANLEPEGILESLQVWIAQPLSADEGARLLERCYADFKQAYGSPNLEPIAAKLSGGQRAELDKDPLFKFFMALLVAAMSNGVSGPNLIQGIREHWTEVN
jgi:hypothetical protein